MSKARPIAFTYCKWSASFGMVKSNTIPLITFPCFIAEIENGGLLSMPAKPSRCLVIFTDEHLAFQFTALSTQMGSRGITPLEVENGAELVMHVRSAKRIGMSCIAIDPRPDSFPPTKFSSQEVAVDDLIEQLESFLSTLTTSMSITRLHKRRKCL
jgi:hypothetical protein